MATILPAQVFRLGPLAIAGMPCEPTTVAGRRVAATVAEAFGVEHVVVNGYANDYAGYCTTAEEFDEQLYEGGCTWFGRWTCAAWRTEFVRLATEPPSADPGRPGRPLPHQVDALRHRPRALRSGLGLFSKRST